MSHISAGLQMMPTFRVILMIIIITWCLISALVCISMLFEKDNKNTKKKAYVSVAMAVTGVLSAMALVLTI